MNGALVKSKKEQLTVVGTGRDSSNLTFVRPEKHATAIGLGPNSGRKDAGEEGGGAQGCHMAKFDLALHPGAIQGKEGIKFCSVA